MGAALKRLAKNRLIRAVKEMPEVFFAAGLIILLLAILYFFEKSEFPFHDQFPGLILDIGVFGILIVWFNKILEKRREIKRYREEIEDYLPWMEPEATYRIVGIINRLNKLGVGDIFLNNAYLPKADLTAANFQGANLVEADLHEANLTGANLQGASMLWADLQRAELPWANLQGANLTYAHLQGADLTDANFQGAELRGAKGLTIEQLSKAKTIYGAGGIDNELIRQIKETYPRLLEDPKQ